MSETLNTYHWINNRVNKREDVPTMAHFQALVFTTRNKHTPAYDRFDSPEGSYHSVPHVDVYVFKTRDELELFVDEAARTSTSFVFYEVRSLGKATVKVHVEPG